MRVFLNIDLGQGLIPHLEKAILNQIQKQIY